MPKKLLIDATTLLSQFTGIARYTYENSKRIKTTKKYDLLFNYLYPSKELKNNKNTPSKDKKARNFLISNKYLKKYSRKIINSINLFIPRIYDIYWQPNIIPNPNIRAKKVIATVHDFSFLVHPESHPKERIKYIKKNFYKEVSKCDHIITGSSYTKQEIIKYLNFQEKDVTVIYHGVDHERYKQYSKRELQVTKKKFNLPKTFLLFVGSIEPRKNLITLLKAFNQLEISIQKNYPLILVGAKGWNNQEILDEINKSKYIRYLGYIEDEELPHIYNLATIFIYPSLYEGFGLPPLEASACGTPSIVSNTTSMPEVCLKTVLYINPTNPIDIKDKIQLLIENKILQKELSLKAIKRAKEFTWDKAAHKHMEVFNILMNQK